MHTNFKLIQAACLFAIAGSSGLAQAALSNSTYGAAKEELKVAYKTEREACDNLTGNPKELCVETANGREKVALAHLQAQRTGSPKDMTKVAEARYEARFDIAKLGCENRTGNEKDVCVKQAKAELEKAKADVKMKKEIRDARNDAEETKMKADYKVAAERCEGLAGDAKSACQASAKARYVQ